jgi:hypothetical protein
LSKASYIPRMDRSRVQRIVAGALRSTIDGHGPITLDWIDSASKRIASQLLADIQQHIDREKATRTPRQKCGLELTYDRTAEQWRTCSQAAEYIWPSNGNLLLCREHAHYPAHRKRNAGELIEGIELLPACGGSGEMPQGRKAAT